MLRVQNFDTSKLCQNIKDKDLPNLEKNITDLDLSKIDYLNRMIILEELLKTARNIDEDFSILNIIVNKWLGNLESGDYDGFIGDLCNIISISIESIVYVMLGCEDISPEEILTTHLETTERSYTFGLMIHRFEEALKKYKDALLEQDEYDELQLNLDLTIQKDTWLRLLDNAKVRGRNDAVTVILNKLENNNKYAQIPSYMKKECPKAVEIDILNSKENAEKMSFELINKKENPIPDEILNKFDEIVNDFSEQECISIVSFFDKNKKYTDDHDVLEGPLNSILYSNKELHICLGAPKNRKFKGCRMLTCVCINDCIEKYEDLDVERLQWFKGKCDLKSCRQKIRKACYAFRLPLDAGGWVGCYCSSKCAMSDANDHIREGLKGEDDFEHFKNFNKCEALILHKGIFDRDDLYENEDGEDLFYSK